jgi:uncharacterized protein YoxC
MIVGVIAVASLLIGVALTALVIYLLMSNHSCKEKLDDMQVAIDKDKDEVTKIRHRLLTEQRRHIEDIQRHDGVISDVRSKSDARYTQFQAYVSSVDDVAQRGIPVQNGWLTSDAPQTTVEGFEDGAVTAPSKCPLSDHNDVWAQKGVPVNDGGCNYYTMGKYEIERLKM